MHTHAHRVEVGGGETERGNLPITGSFLKQLGVGQAKARSQELHAGLQVDGLDPSTGPFSIAFSGTLAGSCVRKHHS